MENLKLLNTESSILSPPRELVQDWIIKIDILRYSLELIENQYELLFSNLENKVNGLDLNTFKKNPILLDYAWSIIEKSHGLFQLIRKLIPEYSFENKILWDSIRLIRNTQQHLDERLDLFNITDHPFLGYLSIIFKNVSNNNDKNMFLLGGYSLRNLNFGTTDIKYFKYKDFKSVRLNSIDRGRNKHSIDLIELFLELKTFIYFLERKIDLTMEKNNFEKYDWTQFRDITVLLN